MSAAARIFILLFLVEELELVAEEKGGVRIEGVV